MPRSVRAARASDLEPVARLIHGQQQEPERHIAYLGTTLESITADIESLGDWHVHTAVAEHDGRLVGALIPELDLEMGRTWLFGPFVDAEGWASIADELYTLVRSALPEVITEEEALSDSRSSLLPAWCDRNGFSADEASVLLDLRPGATRPSSDTRTRALRADDHDAVKRLHDEAFPGTHRTAAALVEMTEPRAVIEVDDEVAGYIAYEVQSDNSGYIDYLAVDAAHRSAGLGRALVEHACLDLFDRGVANVHLSVREGNAAARALYAHVGFVEERIAVPYRKGFSLARFRE